MTFTRVFLCFAMALLAIMPAAHAADEKKADAQLHPNLRKILEEQAKKENKAWIISNDHYAKTCLKGVEPGKPVPKEMAVKSTDCYIKVIDENVRPVALNQAMVDDMTGEWKSLARKYGAGQIDHKQWMDGMHDTQKKFAAARIGIIEGLISDAAKQQQAAAAAAAKTKTEKK